MKFLLNVKKEEIIQHIGAEGLKKLDQLLRAIIKKWPEVEFITSMELGDIISGKTQEK